MSGAAHAIPIARPMQVYGQMLMSPLDHDLDELVIRAEEALSRGIGGVADAYRDG